MLRNESGSLVISADIPMRTYRDMEFGFLYKVKNQNFLYSKPPTKKIVESVNDEQAVKFPISENPYPVFVTTENGLPIIGIQQELVPGQIVIARDMIGYPNVKEVVVFKPKGERRPDMPETGKAIDIQLRGYVLKSDLEEVSENREGFTKPSTESIFPNTNLIEDIHQSTFGDCFFLSSVITILNRPGGEEFIKGMMKQEGKWVTVRFFDPNTGMPVYIKVENSIHQENDNETVHHKARWVHILEKAYAALGIKDESNFIHENKYSYSDLSFREMFGDGGHPQIAMKVLTGQDATEVSIENLGGYPWDGKNLLYSMGLASKIEPFNSLLKWGPRELDTLQNKLQTLYDQNEKNFLIQLEKCLLCEDENTNIIEKLEALLAQEHNRARKTIIDEIIEHLSVDYADQRINLAFAFSSFISEVVKQNTKGSRLPIFDALPKISLVTEVGTYLRDLMLVDHDTCQRLFEHSATNFDTISAQFNFLRSIDRFPAMTNFESYAFDTVRWNGGGKTGLYNQETLDLFSDIESEVRNQHLLVASTASSFEEEFPGLRPKHAYAITGTDEIKGLKYIKIRNPWGRVGVEYNEKNEIYGQPATEVEEPEFLIELSDFVHHFYRYTVSNEAFITMSLDANGIPLQMKGKPIQKNKPMPPAEIKQEDSMFNANSIIAGTSSGAVIGAGFGAALGAGITAAGLVPSFGLSALIAPFLIPISSLICAGMGAMTGCLLSIAGNLLAACYTPNNNAKRVDEQPRVKKPHLQEKPRRNPNIQNLQTEAPSYGVVPGPFCYANSSSIATSRESLFAQSHPAEEQMEQAANFVYRSRR